MAGGEVTKKIWIIANWKSNKTIEEALEWISEVGPNIPTHPNLKVVVCPPFVHVEEIKKEIKVGGFPILVGVQDLSPFEEGPFTGEEAASILENIVDIAILGHSERRANFNETDELVAKKSFEARKYNILPLVCLQSEDTSIPEDVNLVAFEPLSAIGTGNPDTPEDAVKVVESLKQKKGPSLEVLYGGSVTSENAESFLNESLLSGLLIGKASLDPHEFVKIVKLADKTINGRSDQAPPA